MRDSLVSVLLVVLAVGLVGCEAPTSPADASGPYNQLVQVTVSRAEARADTSLFWLRNTGPPQARTLMVDLGIDNLRYDREADALCVWSGEGLWPARGFVTAPSGGTVPSDSVGAHCNIEGDCTAAKSTEQWWRFECV
jgi:hypothetical protein